MPRKVTAWACKFRCGRKVTTHEEDIVTHERECCPLNPVRRTCMTCRHDAFEWEDFGQDMKGYKVYHCAIDEPKLEIYGGVTKRELKVSWNCPKWEAKEE